MSDVTVDLPIYNTPIIDARGNISEVWWRFFATLLERTGGTTGDDTTIIKQRLDLLIRRVIALDALDAASVAIPDIPLDATPGPVSRIMQALSFAPEPVARSIAQIFPISEPVARPPQVLQDPRVFEFTRPHGQQYDPGLHALVTQTVDGFMSAVDKLKLDNLAVPIVSPAEIIADVVTQNTTADGAVVALTFPAASLLAAASFNLRLYGLISSGALAGTLSVWIKIGATKVLTQTFTLPALGQTNTGLFYTASATVRTTGAGGTIQLSSLMTSNGNALNGGPVVGTAPAAINTTIANTITLGWNWSVANAANIATAKNASIVLEKQ